MHKQRLYKDPHNQTACVWCVCTYHEHVPVRFTDGYIEDTGIHWVVCRESKMANRGLGFRLKEGRMCACFGGGGRGQRERTYNYSLHTVLSLLHWMLVQGPRKLHPRIENKVWLDRQTHLSYPVILVKVDAVLHHHDQL